MEEKTRNGGVNATKKIFCKTCKKLFAFKSEGSVELSSSDTRSSCNHCKHPILEIICRVCNVWVKSPHHFTTEQKYENIERHLDSDKHFQKEQVFQSYILYARLKGFDMESEINVDNLKFFLTAMKGKTLGGKVAAKNSLSVILNILDLSSSQYNDLQAHVDNMDKTAIPNFLCFSCNFLVFGSIDELKTHIETKEHEIRCRHLGNLVEERMNLSCSKCDALFNIADVDEHGGHTINEEFINSVVIKPGNFGEQILLLNRKRKHKEEEDDAT